MRLEKFREILARRHTIRAHFWQSCSNYTQQISGLIISVLLARLLTPDDFGQYAYVAAVLSLSILPASWSLSPQIVSEIRTHPEIVSDALHYSSLLFHPRIILLSAACLFLLFTEGWRQALMGSILAVPLAFHDYLAVLRSSMEGRGEFKVNFFDSLLTATLALLISVPAAVAGAGIWALVLPSLPLFAVQVFLFTRMSGTGFRPLTPCSDRRYFTTASKLWVAGCSDSALLRLDKFFLGRNVSMGALGDYNRAFNFAPVGARALGSLLASPTVAALTHTQDSTAKRKLILKSTLILAAVGTANFAVWWFYSGQLVPLIFGPQWSNAIPVFEAMAPLSLAMAIVYLPTTIAMAKRAYGTIATIRIISLMGFAFAALLLHAEMTPVIMAWLLQVTFAFQGLALIAAMSPDFLRRGASKWM